MTDIIDTFLTIGFVPLLIIGICLMGAVLAWVNRNTNPLVEEEDDPDHHLVRSDYQSGMGGGSVTTWKVPKDADAYARLFVPKTAKGKDDDVG